MSSSRVWFITGASSGFGKCMAELALSRGDTVIATARQPETLDDLRSRYSPSAFTAIKLDVTNQKEIVAAFDKAKELFGKIDVVFNNAGMGMVGEVEGTDEVAARRIFETNFWGAVNVTREAMKFFRETNPPGKGGLILVVTSECGIQGFPSYGYYCASKFALEGLHDSLAKEIDPEWNINITIVEPGYFATQATNNVHKNGVHMPRHPAYDSPTLPGNVVRSWIVNGGTAGADPAKGVEKIYEISLLPNPPLRFPIGADCVDAFKVKAKEYSETAEKFASWSYGLEHVNVQMK